MNARIVSLLRSCGLAALAVLVALVLRLLLFPVLGEHSPYLPFTLAVVLSARFGGRSSGIAATALSALAVTWFFIEPVRSFAIANPWAAAGLALFVAVGVAISLLVGQLHESLLATTRAEEALRLKTELVDLSHDAIITADPSRRITGWNGGAVELYGWTESQALGEVTHDFLRTTGQMTPAETDEVLRREGRWDGELSHIARDGRRLVVESCQVLIRGAGNDPAGILEINRDITERKRGEEAIRESEAQFRTLANAIPQLCWMANADGWIFWYNDRWFLYTGTTPKDMEGWGWQSVHDPKALPEVLARWKESIASGQPFDMVFPLRGGDGTFRPFLTRVVPLRDHDGKVVRWFGTNTDIADQRKAEEALRRASEELELALEAANLGRWDYDLDTGEVFRDERCRQLLGITVPKAGYEEARTRVHADDRPAADEAWERALAGDHDGVYHQEFRVAWPDGSVHWVAAHGRVLFEGEGDRRRAVRFVGVNMEVTERRHAEERLRQAQKLESIGVLAGGVAHDFNNYLTVIMGSASSALAECPSCQHSQAILSASERASYLTKQLLAFAGKGHNITTLVNVSELVSRSTGLLAASVPKRVRLNFSLAKDLPCLETDPSRVEQILMNLVINAGEAIPPKVDGSIEVSTSSFEVTPELARLHSNGYDVAAGAYVCLEVRDNGSGMDEATISHIFDPFFTTKFTGRGLGLAALHGNVRSSKGFVEVRSAPGCGTTFRVFLPASAKTRPAEQARVAPPEQARGTSTILVVDDEEMVRKLAGIALRRHGYEVLEAQDGKDALQVLANCSTLPTLALVDLAMPVMGGDELVPILEKQYPGLKVVVSSGYPEETARQGFSPGSIAGFLQKPYTVGVLAAKIGEVLGGSPTRSGELIGVSGRG